MTLDDQLEFDDQEILNISYPKLKNILESLLLITKKPLTIDEIRKILRLDREMIERSLHDLIAEYSGKGVIISKIAGGFQMITNPENVKYVDKLLKSPIETTLSQAALETLAIIAYKQPVTRGDIDNIRGVISDGVLQTLIEKRFIAEIGRGSGVGRPRLYGTTVEFLRHFGLKEISDLSPFPVDDMSLESYKTMLPEQRTGTGPAENMFPIKEVVVPPSQEEIREENLDQEAASEDADLEEAEREYQKYERSDQPEVSIVEDAAESDRNVQGPDAVQN